MLAVLCAVAAGLAVWVWVPFDTPARRLARLYPPGPEDDATGRPHPAAAARPGSAVHLAPMPMPGRWVRLGPVRLPVPGRWVHLGPVRLPVPDRRVLLIAGCVGVVTGLVFMGVTGMIAGFLSAVATAWVLTRQEPPAVLRERRQMAADLPFAADLMVACLLAGRPVGAAVEAAANALPGPLATRLTWVATQLRLGADPEPTWAHLARDPATAALARAMTRAALSGAPVADVLTRLADDARESAQAASLTAARRVAVKAVAPLGLCFLPAFILLGIVPVIASLASTIVLP
ncbi:type II secretion system F family protein [Nonomuraea typhae]|uniref:Type II secretion system F family protein n=1 Tax=Nonomuraea typhae TaxID=2603600 RepID=A0ABW7Z2B8_9ACTN